MLKTSESLFCKTIEKQNRPENMENRMLAKKNVIVYKEPVSDRKGLENLHSEELKNHKSGGANANYNSKNKESGSQISVFYIKFADI